MSLRERAIIALALAVCSVALIHAQESARFSLRASRGFRSIQQSIDALPPDGLVRVDAGTRREKVRIDKPHVILAGVGSEPGAVMLIFGDSSKTAGGTVKSATLTVTGEDFHADNLTIGNDWGSDPANPPSQSVALALTGHHAVLVRARPLSHQDTLYANKGPGNRMARQYFSGCYVEGHATPSSAMPTPFSTIASCPASRMPE